MLFVCSIWGVFNTAVVYSQTSGGERPPTTTNQTQQNIEKGEPLKLHLYSSIFGKEKEIKTSSSDRGAVNRKIQEIFGRFFSIIFTLSGILMVVLLAVHGTRMIYSEFGGNVAAFTDAKGRVKSVAIGTAILLLSWVILNFIAPSLLKPRLFQTITGLQEVGQGNALYSNNLEIPDKENTVTFDRKSGKLTITRCPEIIDDNFKEQVNNIKKGLQFGTEKHPLQYAYQVLYKKRLDEVIYTYEKGGRSLIKCTKGKLAEDITLPNPEIIETVVVFPIVSIEVVEVGKVPGTEQSEPETNIVQKKLWRGLPWQARGLKVDLATLNAKKEEGIDIIKERLSGQIQVSLVNESGAAVIDVQHTFAGSSHNCEADSKPENGPGVRITFGQVSLPGIAEEDISDVLIIDEAQYALEVDLGTGFRTASQALGTGWNQSHKQNSEKTFCFSRNLKEIKITPQFSVSNRSNFYDGPSSCYSVGNTGSGQKREFSGPTKISCN